MLVLVVLQAWAWGAHAGGTTPLKTWRQVKQPCSKHLTLQTPLRPFPCAGGTRTKRLYK